PPEAEAELEGERAEADIVADQHKEEHRADRGEIAVEQDPRPWSDRLFGGFRERLLGRLRRRLLLRRIGHAPWSHGGPGRATLSLPLLRTRVSCGRISSCVSARPRRRRCCRRRPPPRLRLRSWCCSSPPGLE